MALLVIWSQRSGVYNTPSSSWRQGVGCQYKFKAVKLEVGEGCQYFVRLGLGGSGVGWLGCQHKCEAVRWEVGGLGGSGVGWLRCQYKREARHLRSFVNSPWWFFIGGTC